MMAGRDEWMEEAMTKVSPKCSPTMVDSEHPLFLLYTSGSTGKPKGVSLNKDNNNDAANFQILDQTQLCWLSLVCCRHSQVWLTIQKEFSFHVNLFIPALL